VADMPCGEFYDFYSVSPEILDQPLYSVTLNIRVLIVYLHFSHASDHEFMLPTNVLPSAFHRETLLPM
jgi:hypothetical protein